MDEAPGAADEPLWLVDGYNVVHVTLLGGEDRSAFWTADVRARLIDRARSFPGDLDRLWIVFDGPDPVQDAGGSGDGAVRAPRIAFAPSADDWILKRVKHEGPAVVVTADRRLADRCRHAGARIVSPGDFIGSCRSEEA